MNKVKKKSRGRPRRSQNAFNLAEIGKRIRTLRSNARQEEFAALLGISQAQLSKYELGQSAPPLRVLVKLSAKSGTSVDWILTGAKRTGA